MKRLLSSNVLLLLLVSLLLAVVGCGEKKEEVQIGTEIYTTFYPTEYFAKRIGGDRVTVVNPCPENEDAIFWMPDEKTIEKYQKARLIITNGAEFEKWVQKATLPASRLVNTARPFEKDFIEFEKGITHSHGAAGEHTHKGIDGHTWLDPINAKIQAGEIKKAMDKAFPQYKEDFQKGYDALIVDLNSLDAELKKLAETYDKKPILTSHPAYNYIARRYGWNIKNLNLDPEEMPNSEQFAEIKHIMEEFPAKYILWESYPTEEIATRFRNELGLESIEFSPCELLSREDQATGIDYLKVMKQNIENVRPIFE